MPLLPTSVRRRLGDKALAASPRLSTGPEWERHVRDELGLLAPAEGWRDDVEVGHSREKFLFSFNPGGWLRKRG